MENRSRLTVYSLIIQNLKKRPMRFKEILSEVEKGMEIHDEFMTFSQRTFQRYIKEIYQLFSIEIKSNGHNEYEIVAEDNFGTFDNRLFEHFNVFSAMSQLRKFEYTLFTERKSEQGTENMFAMVHAILNGLEVSFTHQKYWEKENTTRKIQPYALKEAMGRWYLLGKDNDGKFKTFGLDRITNFLVQKKKFKREMIDLDALFEGCYGIINLDNEPIVEVKLAFDNFKANYMRSYPLHQSQKEISKNDTTTVFSYQLKITHDLIMAVLSHGKEVKILAPQRLKEEVQAIAREMLGY